MSLRLGSASGTYNVRASELARDRPTSKMVKCVVRFLDDSEATFEIMKSSKAQLLLDKVFEHLELIEKDYFGLQFVDSTVGVEHMRGLLLPDVQMNSELTVPVITSDVMRWLDPLKTMKKQMRVCSPYRLHFRVKFYTADPSKLQEEYTRYHFFLQLKADIMAGKLVVPYNSAVLLASYAVQSELGDFSSEENGDGYLSEFRFISNQSEQFERDVCQLHKQHRGLTPAASEMLYLDQVRQTAMYGLDMYVASWVRDQSNMQIQLGVTSIGLVVFQNNVRINTFSWIKIVKISFKRKQFFIQLKKEQNESLENLVGFTMPSYRSCKNLWRSCVEHHTFFRLHSPPDTKSSFFSVGSKFSGRTQFQTIEGAKRRARLERSFDRSPSKRFARRTVGPTTRDAVLGDQRHFSRRHSGDAIAAPPTGALGNSTSYPTSLRHCADALYQGRATLPPDCRTRHPPMRNGGVEHQIEGRSNGAKQAAGQPRSMAPPAARHKTVGGKKAVDECAGFLERPALPAPVDPPPLPPIGGNGVTPVKPKRAEKEIVGAMGRLQVTAGATPPPLPAKTITYIDDDGSSNEVYEATPLCDGATDGLSNGSAYNDGHGLVTIRMKPDPEGRFGFNVKGGADQSMPIIVSRVAPLSPADLCLPRLNEGDQVLYINGRDVSQHAHEQVVMFIRSSRETHSGQLVLVVRPNVYIGDDTADEPDFQYIPDTHHITCCVPPGGDALAASMHMLREGLDSGALVAQFEQLYRKKAGLSMSCARLSENMMKNRYKDISPYDESRVKIESSGGDYINANFVNMEIPGSGVVNRYIAAQGPLPHTCSDFWQMVWEQACSVVVMLTTQTERGRVKCHQYWPRLYDTLHCGDMTVTCLRETAGNAFTSRDFTLVNTQNGGSEQRRVRQMQYVAWPDHGVPDDSSDFLHFVVKVRHNRIGMVEPMAVHCSAGIGRTGVLITMETAMCLIEANQPVYPLDIVRQMRDQRAMLIQTATQYKFVCEAIMRVYAEKVVQPLDDYKR